MVVDTAVEIAHGSVLPSRNRPKSRGARAVPSHAELRPHRLDENSVNAAAWRKKPVGVFGILYALVRAYQAVAGHLQNGLLVKCCEHRKKVECG